MEPEESREDAPEPVSEPVAPAVRASRSRKPRSSAAAAASTTAARRIPRPNTTGARPTGSRSAATGGQRRPRTASVPPEERATVADALVELPEPAVDEPVVEEPEVQEPVVHEPTVDDPAIDAAVDESPVASSDEHPQTEVDFLGDEELDGVDDPVDAVDPIAAPVPLVAREDPVASEELAALVSELDEPPAPTAAAAASIASDPFDFLPQPIAASAPVPATPSHELTTEPSADADRAATDAFSEIVGSAPGSVPEGSRIALELRGLRKRFGSVTAVDGVDLVVPAGSFYGVVGPNGAGKTTTLSMITGLLRPDAGTVSVYGHDVWTDSEAAKRALGVLPDRLRLFDRLTGAQLLAYTGSLRGMDRSVIVRRTRDLATAFGLTGSLQRPVSDYSLGMTKKIAIAAALLHAPRMLVLDEPFESVDPVSAAAVLAVLRRFTESGGTVILSSHSMELIESACDRLAIIAEGRILAEGPTTDVLSGVTLEDRFVQLAGGRSAVEGMEWLHSYSDE